MGVGRVIQFLPCPMKGEWPAYVGGGCSQTKISAEWEIFVMVIYESYSLMQTNVLALIMHVGKCVFYVA